MTKLPNYVCSRCGRGFTSARSARRHVANVESGNGYVMTEADYRTAIITGKLAPPIPKFPLPTHKKQQNHPLRIAADEFWRGYFRKMGEDTWTNYGSKDLLLTFLPTLIETFRSQHIGENLDLMKFFNLPK